MTLPFDSYSIVLPRILLQISTKSSYVFGVQKPIQKIVSGTIWFDILSFQGSYVNVHLSYIYFLVLKMSWKIVSGTVQFDRYFPFQGFHQVFFKGSCFFLFQKSSKNLNLGQYGLTHIFHLENIGQFLSKAHSDQDKI